LIYVNSISQQKRDLKSYIQKWFLWSDKQFTGSHTHIYTDASKTDKGVGVAAVKQQTELCERMLDNWSIYNIQLRHSLYNIKTYLI